MRSVRAVSSHLPVHVELSWLVWRTGGGLPWVVLLYLVNGQRRPVPSAQMRSSHART